MTTQTYDPATMTYRELVDVINEADALYYNDPDAAVMPDDVYDALYIELVRREQSGDIHAGHTIAADSPTQRVQGTSTFAPTKHTVPMLSLDKVTTKDELGAFLDRTAPHTEFHVEPKYDGASLSLEFEEGKLVRAITRGDGTTGDDVTENAKFIRGVPSGLTIAGEPFDGWIRGEVVIPRADFPEVNAARVAAGQEALANPRNAAAGALRTKDARAARRHRLTFYAYDSSNGTAHLTFGFNSVTSVAIGTDVMRKLDTVLAMRPDFPFDTDGVVIKVVDHEERARLGATGKHPRWAVAFKTAGDTAQTTLKAVTWQTGAGGSVTPVAELEPVYLDGTTISRATLHNPKFIADMRLFVGAPVEIRRMGDVIPGVVGLVAGESIDFEPQPIHTPTECPECGEQLVQEGNSGQVKCPSSQCVPQIVGRLVKWAGRDAADIDAIGKNWIEVLVKAGFLRNPSDFYRLTIADMVLAGVTGDKRPQQFLDSIEKSKGLGMRRALIGFNIPMASEGTAKRLCRHFESMEALYEACVNDLSPAGPALLRGIEDIGDVVARSLRTYFITHASVVKALRELGVNLDRLDEDAPVKATTDSKNFVVTGGFEGYKSRKEPVAILERAGWVSQSGISDRTHYLITDDPNPTSSKAKKAASLGVEVITMARAMELAGVS